MPDNVIALVPPAPKKAPWTPKEMLLDLIKEIDEGKVHPTNMMLFFMDAEPNNMLRPVTWIANVSHAEGVAYLALGMKKHLEEWQNG